MNSTKLVIFIEAIIKIIIATSTTPIFDVVGEPYKEYNNENITKDI